MGNGLVKKGPITNSILVGYLDTTCNILTMFDQLEKKLENVKVS
jgi:ATP-dependent protease HslVU (ClpYQ) peptidase subunit